MNDSDPSFDRLSALFLEVCDLDPPERSRRLDELCAGDAALRRRVEELLAAGDQPSVLDRPLGLDGDPAAGRAAPLRFGAWRATAVIGRGGMGTVFEAVRDDGGVEGVAAVKVSHAALFDEESRRRFELERDTLAALRHPRVARLLDGGVTPEGLPWLAMERVQGEPIDAYCDRRGLGPRERVRLFLQVCDAVAAAHAQLVVHRDLEPSNLLVGQDGHVRLVDFGVALALDRADRERLTRNAAPYTPRYASPEQLRGGRVSVASDVYSLGVVLYELLAGRSPYGARAGGADPTALVRAVVEDDPPPASRVALESRFRRALRGDLDRILACCLRKEPERRYSGVARLRDDLEAWLERRPIRARRTSLLYVIGRAVARHRALSLVTALSLALLAAAVWREARAAREARAERDRAEGVLAFVTDLLSQPDPALAGRDVTVAEAIARAGGRIDDSFASDPRSRAELHRVLGSVLFSHGRLDEAIEHQRAALSAFADSGPGAVAAWVGAANELANSLQLAGRGEEALSLLEEASRVAERRLGAADPLAVRTRANRAILRAQTDAAVGELEESLAAARRIGLAETEADLETALAGRARSNGDLEEAMGHARRALELRRAAGDAVRVLEAEHNLAVLHAESGAFEEAERLLAGAVAEGAERLGADHPDVARLLYTLGGVRVKAGRIPQALEALRRCLDIRRAVLGEEHPDTLRVRRVVEALDR